MVLLGVGGRGRPKAQQGELGECKWEEEAPVHGNKITTGYQIGTQILGTRTVNVGSEIWRRMTSHHLHLLNLQTIRNGGIYSKQRCKRLSDKKISTHSPEDRKAMPAEKHGGFDKLYQQGLTIINFIAQKSKQNEISDEISEEGTLN
ncbi:hypothetical protein QTO34_007991, partial [Cnephaeus nilssonii]